jgi:hypothetical protein
VALGELNLAAGLAGAEHAAADPDAQLLRARHVVPHLVR